MNCLGMPSRDTGQSRVPEPPASSTGTIRVSGMIPSGGAAISAPAILARAGLIQCSVPSRSKGRRHVHGGAPFQPRIAMRRLEYQEEIQAFTPILFVKI